MFSGIVEETGKILAVADTSEGRRLKIAATTVTSDLELGDSVSVSGTCLTVTERGGEWFQVEATLHTLRVTKLGSLKGGDRVNLERAVRLSDRLGGHLVSGHVDGLGQVRNIETDGFSRLVSFAVDAALAGFFVEKGSVTIDGVSLTVAKFEQPAAGVSPGDFLFTVALIPHTMSVTTLGSLKVGDTVNVEVDLIAKYVARLLEPVCGEKVNKAGITLSFLAEHGYTKP
jgi:riboflavin synthase